MKQNFSDPLFIEELKAQKESAVTVIVQEYTSHLFKACLGMGFSEDMANDVSSATWATFFEVLPRFQGRSHIRTFLFGILYNKASEARRANKKFQDVEVIDEVMESRFIDDGHWKDSHSSPHDYAQKVETFGIIEQCLEGLPFLQRSVFTLKVVEEEDNDDICNILEISNTNLRQLLYRGKNQLRECVEKKSEGESNV